VKTHEPNLQEAVSSRKKMPQKNFMLFRRENASTESVRTVIRLIAVLS
jgi:hypothetical protein